MPKKLVLYTLYGLANRLRGIASGISLLSRDEDLAMDVIWEPNSVLSAEYEDLFEPLDYPRLSMVNVSKHPLVGAHIKRTRFGWRHRLARISRGIDPRDANAAASFSKLLPGVSLHQSRFAFRSANTAYLSTCHNFATPPQWQYFVPKQDLRARINEVAEALGPKSVGIHIRRTDNVKSWQKSPLIAFIKSMQDILAESPETRFFLATDSPDVRTALVCIFGKETVVTREGIVLDRDSKTGIEEAVVDMWSLSRTNRILGSYWSSFSEAAAEIGNIPFSTCTIE